MRRSTFLLCAAAIGLAACGSDDDEDIANAAANAANTATNTADTAAGDAGNAAANATDAAGNAAGGAAGKGKGKGGPYKLAPRAVKVEFRGCATVVPVSKPGTCLILKSGGETYDISSARPRPGTHSAIHGTGIYDPRTVGVCMSGKPLTNIKWGPLRGLCPRAKGR